jgi:hypothetical protein
MPDHDALYHRLFGHAGMVAQLLREFVAEPWISDFDLDGMERENAKFHAPTGKRRDGDMVWRIPRRSGGDAYLMLLLEFQSTSDAWMALRALVYVGLLWQHLVQEKRLLPDGRLPPVFPVVLYNGEPRWAAPLQLRQLVGLPEGSPLWKWQPDLQYYIIDELRFSDADLAKRDGLVPLLFRLESSPDPQQVVVLTDALLAWFGENAAFSSLRTVFVELLRSAMEPVAAGSRVPEELLEVRNLLAERAKQWKQQWLQEGRQEGEALAAARAETLRQQALQEGRMEGRVEGRKEGEAAFLLRLIEHRFGPLPGWARERIATADTITLEAWGLRVLKAESIDDVLA